MEKTIRKNKNKVRKSTKESWKGVDIIGKSGFGITDLHSYVNRSDFKKNLKRVKKSGMWQQLIKPA